MGKSEKIPPKELIRIATNLGSGVAAHLLDRQPTRDEAFRLQLQVYSKRATTFWRVMYWILATLAFVVAMNANSAYGAPALDATIGGFYGIIVYITLNSLHRR